MLTNLQGTPSNVSRTGMSAVTACHVHHTTPGTWAKSFKIQPALGVQQLCGQSLDTNIDSSEWPAQVASPWSGRKNKRLLFGYVGVVNALLSHDVRKGYCWRVEEKRARGRTCFSNSPWRPEIRPPPPFPAKLGRRRRSALLSQGRARTEAETNTGCEKHSFDHFASSPT